MHVAQERAHFRSVIRIKHNQLAATCSVYLCIYVCAVKRDCAKLSKFRYMTRQNVTDWTGGQQPGFSPLNYVLKQFYRKKSGPRTPRPPRWPPFPGNVSVERGVAA
jgi:hypothetical protein